MTVFLVPGADETFQGLPPRIQTHALRTLALLASYPRMFPIRQHGLMQGYRCFVIQDFLFYYSVASAEVRVIAIIPGQMEHA